MQRHLQRRRLLCVGDRRLDRLNPTGDAHFVLRRRQLVERLPQVGTCQSGCDGCGHVQDLDRHRSPVGQPETLHTQHLVTRPKPQPGPDAGTGRDEVAAERASTRLQTAPMHLLGERRRRQGLGHLRAGHEHPGTLTPHRTTGGHKLPTHDAASSSTQQTSPPAHARAAADRQGSAAPATQAAGRGSGGTSSAPPPEDRNLATGPEDSPIRPLVHLSVPLVHISPSWRVLPPARPPPQRRLCTGPQVVGLRVPAKTAWRRRSP